MKTVAIELHHFEKEALVDLVKTALARMLQLRDGLARDDMVALLNLSQPLGWRPELVVARAVAT